MQNGDEIRLARRNYALNRKIQILTYDDLLSKARVLLNHLKEGV